MNEPTMGQANIPGRSPAAVGKPRNAVDLLSALAEELGVPTFFEKSPRRIEGTVAPEQLHSFAAKLRNRLGVEHLSAISCVDWIDQGQFELVYHFWSYRDSALISAKVRLDRTLGQMETITDLWQPASFFERDIHEMFGVYFRGNGDLEKYILSDLNGPPPMRKDFVSRNFAHEHFQFKTYDVPWDERVQGGYYGSRNGEEKKNG
jgi:NADH-quinone oxidoreductase subunit C